MIAYFDASLSGYRIKSISIVSKRFQEFKSEVNILSNCLKLTKQGNLRVFKVKLGARVVEPQFTVVCRYLNISNKV